jgi:hypothetical protein
MPNKEAQKALRSVTALTYAVEPVRDLVADNGTNPRVIQGPVTRGVTSELRGYNVIFRNLHSTYLLLIFLPVEEGQTHHTSRER